MLSALRRRSARPVHVEPGLTGATQVNVAASKQSPNANELGPGLTGATQVNIAASKLSPNANELEPGLTGATQVNIAASKQSPNANGLRETDEYCKHQHSFGYNFNQPLPDMSDPPRMKAIILSIKESRLGCAMVIGGR